MKKIDPSIIIILLIMLALNFTQGEFDDPKQWIYRMLCMLPGIIIGLSFHEFAHGFVSYKLGDPTPKLQGRATLNPMAHVDPIGFIALLFCGFGWGVPVEINPAYYKHRRRDELLVALAGVCMNLFLAVVFSILLKIFVMLDIQGSAGNVLIEMTIQAVIINLVLMVFNLLPVPPLDGFGIITQIFDLRKYDWYYPLYEKGFIILLALILFNITSLVLSPAVSGMWNLLCHLIIY